MKPKRVELRVRPDDLKRWRFSAAMAGMTLSAWIRKACEPPTVIGKYRNPDQIRVRVKVD